MSKKKMTIYGGLIAAIVAMSFAAPAFAETPEQLRARADRMEMAEQRAEYTKALVRDVLADAESRAMFQGSKSPVTVNLHGFAQTRYSYSGGGGLEAEHGFNVPRARLILSGDVFDWEYKVSGQWRQHKHFRPQGCVCTGRSSWWNFPRRTVQITIYA